MPIFASAPAGQKQRQLLTSIQSVNNKKIDKKSKKRFFCQIKEKVMSQFL